MSDELRKFVLETHEQQQREALGFDYEPPAQYVKIGSATTIEDAKALASKVFDKFLKPLSEVTKVTKPKIPKCRKCRRKFTTNDTSTSDAGFCTAACEKKAAQPKRKKKVSTRKKGERPKPVLPGTFRTVYEVDYGDYDNYVKEVYGIDSDVVCDNEWSNDSVHNFPNIKADNGDSDKEDKEKIRKGEKPDWRSPGIMLECLCEDGYIQPGNYVIEVCW